MSNSIYILLLLEQRDQGTMRTDLIYWSHIKPNFEQLIEAMGYDILSLPEDLVLEVFKLYKDGRACVNGQDYVLRESHEGDQPTDCY